MKSEERIDTALSIAKHHFKVPKLLHAKGKTKNKTARNEKVPCRHYYGSKIIDHGKKVYSIPNWRGWPV
jgi:hypothetical protein